MENGIKNKLDLLETGQITVEAIIRDLFQCRNDEYFKSTEGNNYLKQIFDSSISNELKCVLIYIILNYNDLEESWHDKLAKFAIDNIDLLNNTEILPSLINNNDFIIYDYLTQRVFNPKYIKSKKWIYILSVPYDNNRNTVERVLEDISKETYPFSVFLPYPISKNIALTLIEKYKI